MHDDQLAEIKARLESANPYELAYHSSHYGVQAKLWEAAIQDGLDLLTEVERLRQELALAKMGAMSRAGRVPK